MTEKEFWAFINTAVAIKGRMEQISSYSDSCDTQIQENGRYIGGHAVLFNGHDRLSEDTIRKIGSLLFDRFVSKQAKEAILMLLAHHPKKVALEILRKYNKNPDKELTYYAKTALWECRIWKE
ncbi:MAG: hypothetical protein JXB40_05535 [Candidatus Omnitrophica bacterium]|nr:hypothetical protein [Candidatus Omnitrophota bacterium]